MWWWPWQSGRSRNREQRSESLKRATESATQRLDAASADNQQAAAEAKVAIERRRAQAAPLRPLLKQLVDRVSEDRLTRKEVR